MKEEKKKIFFVFKNINKKIIYKKKINHKEEKKNKEIFNKLY